MDPEIMQKELKAYLIREVLDGTDQNIDNETPLLEWGIIDSISMTGLLAFVEERFGVEIPDDEIVPEHFENLDKLVGFVMSLSTRAGASQPA